MAVIKQGILGGFSGSVGSVTGGSWKGIATMRAKPLSVANPRTAPQVGQRTKFSKIQAIAGNLLTSIVKPLWDRFAQQMSGYNYFIQQNIDQVSAAGVVTWNALRTSIGSLTGYDNVVIGMSEGTGIVEFTWDDNSGTGSALGTDIVYGAFYNEDQDEWLESSSLFQRDEEAGGAPAPASWVEGDTVHAYLSFKRADGTIVSTSQYFTFDIVA
jgi:hypothetical protein